MSVCVCECWRPLKLHYSEGCLHGRPIAEALLAQPISPSNDDDDDEGLFNCVVVRAESLSIGLHRAERAWNVIM